jgi:competence protein ComFC
MGNSLLEILFPRFCIGCGYVGTYVCQTCESKMKRIKRSGCFYCEKPSPFGLTHPGCKRKNGIDGYISLYLYNGIFKKILQESKYKGARLVLETLLSFPQNTLQQDIKKWNYLYKPVFTYVPLHRQRERERGFNQSEIIINMLFPQYEKKILLKRINNTAHLAHINDKNERKKHIKGAFSYINSAHPETAVVVDDVITSGATLLECVKEMKENGVQTVLAFSLAKG